MSETSIYEIVSAAIVASPGDSDCEIGARVLSDLGVPDEPASVLLPLLRKAVQNRRRELDRDAEETIDGDNLGDEVTPPLPGTGTPVRPGGDRHQWLSVRFVIPTTGEAPTWAEATVAQHQARIAYLLKQARGIRRTIGRHEWAVGLITGAGVRCLGEIDGITVQVPVLDVEDAA